MIDKTDKIILVTGATGNQGGATLRHLLANGWKVRALTRNPDKPAAQALAKAGVEIAKGDLDHHEALAKALEGVYGVFSVQNFWESGVEGETRQGKALANAAKTAGVQHLVYSSVGGAERKSGILHFESKFQIEEHIRTLGLPATVLRPVFFMENFLTFMGPKPNDDGTMTLNMPLPADKDLQLIAVDDIGAFAALAFENPEEFIGKALEIAGDELSPNQIAEIYTRVSGKTVHYVPTPIEQARAYNPESAVMFDWFNTKGYEADIPAIRQLRPNMHTFEEWLQKQ